MGVNENQEKRRARRKRYAERMAKETPVLPAGTTVRGHGVCNHVFQATSPVKWDSRAYCPYCRYTVHVKAAESDRRCISVKPDGSVCGTRLNQYNPDDVCGPCDVRERASRREVIAIVAEGEAKAREIEGEAEAVAACG